MVAILETASAILQAYQDNSIILFSNYSCFNFYLSNLFRLESFGRELPLGLNPENVGGDHKK